MSLSSPKPPPGCRPGRLMTADAGSTPHDSAQGRSGRRRFPGWRWILVAPAFPIAALIGRAVGGHVDVVEAALIGGALTGAGLGAVQWWRPMARSGA